MPNSGDSHKPDRDYGQRHEGQSSRNQGAFEARRDPGGCGRMRTSPVLVSLSCEPHEKQMVEPMVSVPHSSQIMVTQGFHG